MLLTRRHKVIWDGSRRYVGRDHLYIDPAETDRLAREAVDSTEVDELVAEFKAIELTEETFARWYVAKNRLALAVKRYQAAVDEYARANPVHFKPRADEEIVCPLIEYAETTRIERNDAS